MPAAGWQMTSALTSPKERQLPQGASTGALAALGCGNHYKMDMSNAHSSPSIELSPCFGCEN